MGVRRVHLLFHSLSTFYLRCFAFSAAPVLEVQQASSAHTSIGTIPRNLPFPEKEEEFANATSASYLIQWDPDLMFSAGWL